MSTLWVHVKRATVDEADPGSSVQAVLRIGSASLSTHKAHAPKPQWNEDFAFTIDDLNASLTVELQQPKLFQPKLLGLASIPLYSVRHSNKPGDGHWSRLFLPTSVGSLRPTQHQIQLDTHFELPRDIPKDLAEALDRKLQNLDNILEKELENLENQKQRLVSGDLTPPSLVPGNYTYANSTSSASVSAAETFSSPTPPRSSPSPPTITITTPPSSSRDQWRHSRDSSSPSSTPPRSAPATPPQMHRKRKTEPGSRGRDSGSDSQSPSPPQKSSQRSSLPSYQTASYNVERSPELHRRMRTPEGKGIEPVDIELIEQGRLTHHKWQKILKNPDFQKQIFVQRQERGDATDGGSQGPSYSALADLVSQLTTVQRMSVSAKSATAFFCTNTEFRSRSRSVINTKRKRMKDKHLIDEDLKMSVYKRTMKALVYPASAPNAHNFVKWTAHKPTMCSVCDSLLWGLSKQGVKCTTCSKICHERCASLASKECFHTDKRASAIDSHLTAISDKMQRTVTNHASMFTLLRDAFGISQQQHELTIKDTMQKILENTQNFMAQVTVKVIAASGLNLTKVSDRRVYMTVDVANSMKRTTTFKGEGNPQWNEEFVFISTNYHEQIKIRVWNERHSAMVAMVANKLTKESDHFLGEKIIDLRTVGAPVDVWYKLRARTKEGQVSGSLNLNLSSHVEGEDVSTSFHEQYMRLHELMFHHVHIVLNFPLISINPEEVKTKGRKSTSLKTGSLKSPSPEPELEDEDLKNIVLLPRVAQDIINEFALRYFIDPIYRLMCHMALLVNHYSLEGALQVMDGLLKNLKHRILMHVAADNSIRAVGAKRLLEEHMNAFNFGRDNVSRLLGEKLLTSLRLDLQQYREFYPSNDPGKLEELKQTCQLITTVVDFLQQVMGAVDYQLEDLMLDSMKECFQKTFYFVVQNSMPKDGQEQDQNHPGLNKERPPFQFFYDIIDQLRAVVYEDRTVYEPIVSQFCSFSLGDVSAVELWGMFGATIQDLFETKANRVVFPPNEYIKLYFSIKNFYESVVQKVPSRVGVIPEYPHWFMPNILHWMQEFQKNAVMFMSNAWEDDKETFKFARYEEQNFSSSNYQMFFFLHKGFEMVAAMQPGEVELRHNISQEFALIIRTVVQQYVDNIAMHLPECVGNLEQACMLLNNLQALRVNVQSLYEELGGNEGTGPAVTEILHDFQVSILAKELSSWCVFVARSLTHEVLNRMGLLQNELLRLRGQGDVERHEVKVIVGPLLDMLTERARVIAATCEPVVLQKVIKEMWYVVMEALHRILLPKLRWEGGGAPAAGGVQFPPCNYTIRQCTGLEMVLDILKEFFTENEQAGLKQATIDRGIKQLRRVIGLYRQTTEALIAEFIVDATGKSAGHMGTTCGEVSMAVEAYHHPATGELDGTIRVISASNLKPFTEGATLRTAIEITLVMPHSFGNKRKFVTHARNGSNSPKFNETFQFTLPKWENYEPQNSELQVTAKHRSRLGADKVIGVAVLPLSTMLQEANVTISLGPSIKTSDRGQALLNVLSVRTNDDTAKEFVALKSQLRSSYEEES